MFKIVLYQPEIPPNTGNIMRLCANTGCELHLVRPLGFSITDRQLERAGMDYRERATYTLHDDWETCVAALGNGRRGVEVTLQDSGPGIPAELRECIFNPFVTTKPSGAGLGLSIVRQVAEVHGATARAGNADDGGAVMTIIFPPLSDSPPGS